MSEPAGVGIEVYRIISYAHTHDAIGQYKKKLLHSEDKQEKIASRCTGSDWSQSRSVRALERAGGGAGRGHARRSQAMQARDTLLHVLGIELAVKLPGAVSDRAGDVIVRRAGGKRWPQTGRWRSQRACSPARLREPSLE